MEIKTLEKKFVYYRQVETSLNTLIQYVGTLPMAVLQETAEKGIKVTGPQIWNYHNVDGNPDRKFKLDVCFPVDTTSANGDNQTKWIDGFRCATCKLNGSWDKLKDAYEELISEMAKENLHPAEYCREVYHVVDMEHPENNVTEIQLGILE